MLVTASWEGGEEVVEVDEGCRSVGALRHTLAAAVPELDAEKVCLEIGGCAADDEAVCSLCEGSVVTVSATLAVRAAAALREEGCDVNLKGFCTASQEGNMRLCELYLDAEVHRTMHGQCWTPLHVACRKSNLPLCALLIERGHPLDVQDYHGGTPLHLSVADESVELCRLLIDGGCSLNDKCPSGDTPLHWAILRNYVEVCTLLIDSGCRLDIPNRINYTPLQYLIAVASFSMNYIDQHGVELCQLLIDKGAAADLTVAQRWSLCDIAARSKCTAIHKLLTDLHVFPSGTRHGNNVGQGGPALTCNTHTLLPLAPGAWALPGLLFNGQLYVVIWPC